MTQHKIRSLVVFEVTENDYQEFMTGLLKEKGISISEISISQNENLTYDYTFFLDMPDSINEESIVKSIEYRCMIDFIR